MKNKISNTPVDLEIKGDISEQKSIVKERWNRLKNGDLSFMGYKKSKKSIIQIFKNLFK